MIPPTRFLRLTVPRGPQSAAATARKPLHFFGGFGLLFAVTLSCAFLRGEPYHGVFWMTVACAVLALFTFFLQFYANTASYSARVVATYQMMICVALAFCVQRSSNILVPGTTVRIDVSQAWLEYICAQLAPLLIPAWVGFRSLRAKPAAEPDPGFEPSGLATFLVLACPLVFGRNLAPYVPAIAGYVLQVLSAGLLPVSFFAGKAASRCSRVLIVWVVGLTLNAGFNTLLGARGAALIPVFFFGLGVMFSLSDPVRRVAAIALVILALPGVYIIGLLGLVRDEIGRDDMQLVSTSTFRRIVEVAGQSVATPDSLAESDALATGMERVVPWCNVVVPVMTPRSIAARGASGLATEAAAYMQLFGRSRTGTRDLLEANLGTAPATDYGFNVNEATSVEWGVLADGWSRFGLPGGVLFTLCAVLLAVGAEAAIRRMRLPPYAKIVGFCVLITISQRLFANPLLDVVRFLVLYAALFGSAIFLIDVFVRSCQPIVRRRGKPPARPLSP